MAQARRAAANIIYNGRDISRHIMDFNYTDNYDQTDDISVTLEDRNERFINDLFPRTGDTLDVKIEVIAWNSGNDNRSLELGYFEIDSPEYTDVLTLNAVAVPITSNIRSEKKNRAWVDISLSSIARDISGNAELVLVYETDFDPFYDNADQNDKSDLEFLEELCKSDGLCLKVTDGQLIIFEEYKYEQKPAVHTIKKGSTDIIGNPRFRRNSKDIYRACEISYFDPKTDQMYKGFFEPINPPDVGHILKLRERFNSVRDDINLDRKARARLRERNKNEWICNITLKGDIIYFTGTNIDIEGFGVFDGKYHITTVSHPIRNGGYTVSLSLRRCLIGY